MRLIDADAIPWTDLNADIPNTKIKMLITFADKVNRMPTIEEHKKGKWINEGIYGEGHSECSIRCSNCDWHYIGYLDDYKFCPNCGSYNGGKNEM